MIVKKIIGIEAKAQTLKILNLGLKERMDHRLNVVTYWYLLERNKIAEHDISFVCASLFGVVIEYPFCLLSRVVTYFKYYALLCFGK